MRKQFLIFCGGLLLLARISTAQTSEEPATVNTNTVAYLAQQTNAQPSREIVYKKIDGQDLKLHVFNPSGFKPSDSRPCFLIIHGGGWVGGTAKGFYPFAAHFAQQGLVGISLDYRLLKKNSRQAPLICVQDGRSAVRYLRSHAAELGINPDKIIVGGGSAGGHVAACTAFAEGVDEKNEETAISCTPDALVLYWPVLDNFGKGPTNAVFLAQWRQIYPLQLVRPQLPPTLVFQGTGDRLVPLQGAKDFQEAMLKAGNRCELVVQPNGTHGYMMYNLKFFNEGMERTDEFLKSLGYIPK